jgi:hypothetical protein
MDHIFGQQRRGVNAHDNYLLQEYTLASDILSSPSSIHTDEPNEMNVDDGFSGGFSHLFAQHC